MNIPKKNENAYEVYRKNKMHFRLLKLSDAGRLRAIVLVTITKGRGKQKRFAGFYKDFADINSVGKTFADLYLLTERKPIRVKYSNGDVLIEDDL
jgi:hypothetical protein